MLRAALARGGLMRPNRGLGGSAEADTVSPFEASADSKDGRNPQRMRAGG